MAKKKPVAVKKMAPAKIPSAKKQTLAKRLSGRFASLFCKRSIIIISERKTQHVPFSGLTQFVGVIALIGFVGWASYSSGSYMAASAVLDEKERKLATTTEENERVGAEFALLKRDLQKLAEGNKSGELNDYAKMMTQQFANEEDSNLNPEFAEANKAAEVSDKYNAVFERIDYLENKVKELQSTHDMMVSDIKATTGGKIAELERVIAATGIDKAPLERQAQARQQQAEQRAEKYGRIEADARGGPFIPTKPTVLKDKEPELYFNLKRVMTLNDIVTSMPLDTPMTVSNYRKTSGFGTRVDPFRGALAFHSGVDLAGPIGMKVKATSDGTVSFTGWRGAYGNLVELQHGYGFATRYGHLRQILVKPGQTIKKGQVIAIQGSTGRSTGNHVHYEVRFHDKPINPNNFLKAGADMRAAEAVAARQTARKAGADVSSL